MKKLLILVAFSIPAILSASKVSAQNRFGVGVGYAPFFLMSVDGGVVFKCKYDAFFEWRYDFGKHFDIGAKLDYKVCSVSAFDMRATKYKGILHCASLMALADFNFRPGKTVNPFIGIGSGPAWLPLQWTSRETRTDMQLPDEYYEHLYPLKTDHSFTWIVSPTIGVELFRHLRLSTSVDISLKANADVRSPVCLNVGWVF